MYLWIIRPGYTDQRFIFPLKYNETGKRIIISGYCLLRKSDQDEWVDLPCPCLPTVHPRTSLTMSVILFLKNKILATNAGMITVPFQCRPTNSTSFASARPTSRADRHSVWSQPFIARYVVLSLEVSGLPGREKDHARPWGIRI